MTGTGARIVIAGAGTIGCYVGGRLAAAGHDVTFLGRDGLQSVLAQNGLSVSDYHGNVHRLKRVHFETNPACLRLADLVLVAVKSGATPQIAAEIAIRSPNATIVSLQNGVSNPGHLRAAMPEADIRGAVVEFNVVHDGQGRFHQATSGAIALEDSGPLAELLSVPGLTVKSVQDIRPIQWGKLLVNLNNGLNALSGLTLVEQLRDRQWRRLLADQMAETLRVLKAAGIKPARFTSAPVSLVPIVLRLPTGMFTRVAKAMLTIDPEARSSMQDDLIAGRKTEIDALQGEVIALADKLGASCPIVQQVSVAVKAAENAANGPPRLDPRDLRA